MESDSQLDNRGHARRFLCHESQVLEKKSGCAVCMYVHSQRVYIYICEEKKRDEGQSFPARRGKSEGGNEKLGRGESKTKERRSNL
jgi:hypothetical protein